MPVVTTEPRPPRRTDGETVDSTPASTPVPATPSVSESRAPAAGTRAPAPVTRRARAVSLAPAAAASGRAGTRTVATIALALAAALAAGGCRATVGELTARPGAAPPTSPTTAAPAPPTTEPVGRVKLEGGPHAAAATEEVPLYARPGARRPISRDPGHDRWGGPAVFLVKEAWRDERGELWLRLLLPRRPNGSSAWALARDLELIPMPNSAEVDLSERRLRLLRHGKVTHTYRVSVGRPATPTPVGDFYVTVKLQPPTISRVYGAWALGLSGFSDVLDQFGTGDGQIALHGGSAPWSLGKAVSNGCVRLANDDINEVARLLPAGAPVRIRA
jgi:L,D-transpeptidase catalytic domain